MNIGTKIKQIRNSKNMSLEELSKKSGISLTELSNIENNKCKPTVVTIKKISKAFDYDYDKLYDYLY